MWPESWEEEGTQLETSVHSKWLWEALSMSSDRKWNLQGRGQ